MDEQEIVERRMAFNQWLIQNGKRIGYYNLPSSIQGTVHEALRKAFNGGQIYEAKKHEPISVGGRY